MFILDSNGDIYMFIKYDDEEKEQIKNLYISQGLILSGEKRLITGNFMEFKKPEDIIRPLTPKPKDNLKAKMEEMNSAIKALQDKTALHDIDIEAIKLAKEIKK